MRCNPALRVFAERLRAKGKRPKVVITVVMRKLPLLAWTLVRTGQPFSPTHGLPVRKCSTSKTVSPQPSSRPGATASRVAAQFETLSRRTRRHGFHAAGRRFADG
jgi:hypothetical protein